MNPDLTTTRKIIGAATAAVLLGGCASFSPDGGFNTVQSLAKERTGKDVKWIRSDADADDVQRLVAELLASPLSVDEATQIALLNNRGLQATYAELGIAEADLVQSGRMTNPHFAYLQTRNGEARKIEWALTFPIVDLLTIPLRTKVEARRFEQTKLEVSARVLETAFETRRAFFDAVAAEELVRYLEQVKASAEAGAELGRRMAAVGNWPKLAQMREQAFYAETVARLARAKRAAVSERERLTRLMGLYGEDLRFRLPERLPELPAERPEGADLEAAAVAQRLDIQSARRQIDSLAASLGLSKATRYVNALELGPARTKEDDGPWLRGPEFSLQIPIFDWGSARVARAEAQYMQSVHHLTEVATNARSEVRDAYTAAMTTYETARHYRDEIVPLRKKISEENLLRYQGMLIGVFELLADAREQVASVSAYIDSLREFWQAQTDLQAALNGSGGGPASRAAGAAGAVRMIPNPALAGH